MPHSSSARILSRRTVFDGFHSLEIVQVEPKSLRHNGYAGKIEREVFGCGNIASVLLYLPETDEVLLNQQFRMAPFLKGEDDPFLFECAAGAVDEGETPEEAARREALEETGCHVDELEPIGSCYTSPGCLNEKFHLYVGRIGKAEVGHHGLEDEGEEIKTHLLSATEAIDMLDRNIIKNATSALTLHWFARNKDRLRKKWLQK